MEKYYFLKSVTEKTNLRIKPLPDQTMDDGSDVSTEWVVQCDKAIRGRFGIGTKFVVSSLTADVNFYRATGKMQALDREAKGDDLASNEAFRAYDDYMNGRLHGTPPLVHKEPIRKSEEKTFLSKMKSRKEFAPPGIESGFHVDPDIWYLFMRNIRTQVNTMLIGPTGTGKTELALLICEKLGIPLHAYDMGSMYDPVAGLLGVHRLEKGGVSKFEYAKFTQSIQGRTGVLLDELSRAPVTTNNILFPLLDSRRCLPVEMAGENDVRNIPVHAGCAFIATANVGSEYTGTNSMDKALVNRFFPIELSYPSAMIEAQIIINRCGISKMDADKIVAVIGNIRMQYARQELSSSVSTREALMMGSMVADGFSVLFAIESVILPMFEGSKTEGERQIAHKIIMSR